MTAHSTSQSEVSAHARSYVDRDNNEQWYVYWETNAAFGSRGWGLTQSGAENLAERIRSGEEKP